MRSSIITSVVMSVVIFLSLDQVFPGCFSRKTGAFVREIFLHPKQTGSFGESGPMLANQMVVTGFSLCDVEDSEGIDILEVGAGTGPFTEKIVKLAGKNDRIHVIECNPRLAEILRQNFKHDDRVTVHCCFLRDFKLPENCTCFPLIFCGLPWNQMNSKQVEENLDAIRRLRADDGVFVYFQYIGGTTLKKWAARLCYNMQWAQEYLTTCWLLEKFAQEYDVKSFQKNKVFETPWPTWVTGLKGALQVKND